MSLFYKFCENTLRLFFKTFYKHTVHFPDGEFSYPDGAILASNHTSFYDPPLIAVSWNDPISFLARKSLFDNAILRAIITRLNAHPVKGGAELSTLKLSCSLLQKGNKVVIFPEGTRSKTGEIATFKRGVGMLAMRANCAIIPIYIHGAFEAWPYNKKLPTLFCQKTACVFGRPIHIDDITDCDPQEKQQKIADLLYQEICSLKKWYLSNYGDK